MAFLLGGAYDAYLARGTPKPVESSMSASYNTLWLYLIIRGPLVVLFGKALARFRATSYGGLVFQLTGYIATSGALLIYVLAFIPRVANTVAAFSVFVIAACCFGSTLFTIRSAQRVIEVEGISHE